MSEPTPGTYTYVSLSYAHIQELQAIAAAADASSGVMDRLQSAVSAMQDEGRNQIIESARERWHKDGEIEIDDYSLISAGDEDSGGAYVMAWVWTETE